LTFISILFDSLQNSIKSSIKQTCSDIAVAGFIALQSSSASVLISDFKPSTYTNDVTFIGVGSWANPFDGAPSEFQVTPDTSSG